MAKSKYALGLELVSGEVRLALVALGEGGPTLQRVQTVAAGEDLARAIRVLPRRPGAAVCAVPLEHAAIRVLSLPPSTEENLERVVLLEAEAVLPVPAEELALSHHVLGMTEQSRLEVLVAAARQEAVKQALDRVNCAPWMSSAVTVSTMALVNALQQLRGAAREGVCAVLKVEGGHTELLVLDRSHVIAAQHIPVGCGSDSPVAAGQPVSVGGGGRGAGHEGGLMAQVLPWIPALSQQVRYALQALCYERGLEIERLYLCGEGAARSGVEWQLSERLECPLSVLAPQAAEVPDAARYAVAYGCALQAVGVGAYSLNLTPARLSFEREVVQRRQTRFSWSALAASVVVAGALVFGAAVHNRTRAAELAEARLREVQVSVQAPPASPKELKETGRTVEAVMTSRVSPAKLLGTLGRVLPQGTWLAELSYTSSTGAMIRGYSLEESGAQRAQIALLRQRLFDEVTLDYRSEERINDVPVWGFQLTCKLRSEEPARGARRRGAGR